MNVYILTFCSKCLAYISAPSENDKNFYQQFLFSEVHICLLNKYL